MRLKKKLNKFDVKVRYAPVVWSAETIALCYLLDVYTDTEIGVDITTVMHKKSTIKFQGKLVEEILKRDSVHSNCKVKHTRNYIVDKERLTENIECIIAEYPNCINVRLLKWILSEDTKYLFTCDEVVQHQLEVEKLYNEGQSSSVETFDLYGNILSLKYKCW